MAFSVNTNAQAFTALQQLNSTNQELQTTQQRVSTGLAVSSVTDDASTFLIAENQRSDLAGLNAVSDGLSRASSTLDVGINATESVSDLLNDAREIAVSAQDAGLDADSREALQNDFNAIVDQIDSVVNQASFNGNNLVGDNPDDISALTGVNRQSSISSIQVGGTDLTTDSTAATSDSLEVSDLGDLSEIDTTGSAQQNVLQALDRAGDDQNVIQENSSGDLTFDFSNATVVDDGGDGTGTGTNDTVEVSFGNGALTVQATGVNFSGGSGVSASDFGSFSGNLRVADEQGAFGGDGASVGSATVASRDISEIDLTDQGNAAAAVPVVDNFANSVQNESANFGAAANQVELQQEFTSNLQDSVEEGIGNLVDADLARESANLQSLQTQQQLGLQALGIANQAPQAVLSLFGG